MLVTYHSAARAELVEATDFYKKRSRLLSQQFVEVVAAAISAIQRTPTRWPCVEADVRRCPLRRFPYAVYYQVFPGQLYVLVVKHHRRAPGYWQQRLSDEPLP